jgi:hypothetical protein
MVRLTDILHITKIDGHEVRAAPPRTWMPLLVLLDVRLTSSSSWAGCARWHLAPAAHGSILETTGRFVVQQHGSSAVPGPTPPQPAALSGDRAVPARRPARPARPALGPGRARGRAGRGAGPGRASPPPTSAQMPQSARSSPRWYRRDLNRLATAAELRIEPAAEGEMKLSSKSSTMDVRRLRSCPGRPWPVRPTVRPAREPRPADSDGPCAPLLVDTHARARARVAVVQCTGRRLGTGGDGGGDEARQQKWRDGRAGAAGPAESAGRGAPPRRPGPRVSRGRVGLGRNKPNSCVGGRAWVRAWACVGTLESTALAPLILPQYPA